MTYAVGGSVQAGDFNTLVTGYANGAPNTSAAALNTVWSVGGQNKGYGQPVTAAAAVGDAVAAIKWANIVSNTASAATHQGSSITAVTAPATGGIITYLAAIPSNLDTIFNNRLNAQVQGSTFANTATRGTTWNQVLTFEHVVTFTSGDAARYFFNAGGQLAITCSHPSGTGINLIVSNLASNIGTVVLSAPTAGTATIASTSYNGVTKIGGSGSATISTNSGYYAMNAANTQVFQQFSGSYYYLSTTVNVAVNVKSNAVNIDGHGDAGSQLTIYTVWDEVPDGSVVSSGSATMVTVKPPESTNIANTWGAISLSGTVSGT